MKLFAVDDDQVFLELLEARAYDLGVTGFTGVTSPFEALRQLEHPDLDVDCILLDIQMPGMDGIELCRRIKTITTLRHVPIVMLTSLSNRDSVFRAFEAGANDYIAKPLDTIDLGARLIAAKRTMNKSKHINDLGRALACEVDTTVIVDRCRYAVSSTTLQNMTYQLSRYDLFFTKSFSVTFNGVVTARQRMNVEQFLEALDHVCSSIQSCFSCSNLSIAYIQDGIFLCVALEPEANHILNLRRRLPQLLKDDIITDSEIFENFDILAGPSLRLLGAHTAVQRLTKFEERAMRNTTHKQRAAV